MILVLFVLILNILSVGATLCDEDATDGMWGCPPAAFIKVSKDLAKRKRDGEDLPSRSTLDLGCGASIRNPFLAEERYGLDIFSDPSRNISAWDGATEAIPFPDESFDYVTAYDFLEHIPRLVYAPERRNSLVEVMNEVHRILKPCGVFFSVTPVYPTLGAFADPTHVNYMTKETFANYFDHVLRWADRYGFTGNFYLNREMIVMRGMHAHVTSQALKGECVAPPLSEAEQQVREIDDELKRIGEANMVKDAYDLYMDVLEQADADADADAGEARRPEIEVTVDASSSS